MEKGFSLIELLCILGLLGLLATLAYPSYTKHLMHTRRLDGQQALLDLAIQLEKHHLKYQTYQKSPTSQTTSTLGWYHLSIIVATKNSYQLKATPIKGQAKQDKNCPVLTLDVTGQTGPHAGCW